MKRAYNSVDQNLKAWGNLNVSANYAKLFREAVRDSVRDYYALHPALMIEGFWLIRLKKRAPLVPARTYLTSSEPGNPKNLLDRWPLPILAGEILGQVCDPLDIFAAPERQPLRSLIKNGVHLSVEEHYRFRVADAQHAAEHRPEDPLADPLKRVNLENLPPLF